MLKIIYGMDLDGDELRFWNAFNGFGVYDDLGYLVDVQGQIPYIPQEYEDITLIFGRRSGKTERVSSFSVAYEALLGGHKDSLKNKSQDPVFLQVAQDLPTAKANLRQFILHWIESSPIGVEELKKRADAITAESVKLDAGLITVGPPSIKLRSQAIAVCAMDELAVWPKDREAANPDVEVEIAVRPAMAQFEFRKLIKTSTPWTEEGLLWEAACKGTKGRLLRDDSKSKAAASKVLVLRAPTAAMGNPAVPKTYLFQEQAKDADAFRRENLAEFAKSVTNFLSPSLLRAAVTSRVRRRAPEAGVYYIATMDPAFRRDAFAFCIGHLQGGRFVLDYLDAVKGTTEAPISPGLRMSQIASICKSYGISLVTTDQYHDLSLQEIATGYGLSIDPCPLTSKVKQQMWGDFLSLLNQSRLDLLDDHLLLEEFMGMERHLSPSGSVQIEGRRDDRATVVVLAVHKSLQYGEHKVSAPKVPKAMSTVMRESVQRKMRGQGQTADWWNH